MKNQVSGLLKLIFSSLLVFGGGNFSIADSEVMLEQELLPESSALLQSCFDCHGVQGYSTKPIYPSLAGLDREDLYLKLQDYRALRIKTHKSEMMSSVVEGLSDKELSQLAEYFSRQPKKEIQPRRRGRN